MHVVQKCLVDSTTMSKSCYFLLCFGISTIPKVFCGRKAEVVLFVSRFGIDLISSLIYSSVILGICSQLSLVIRFVTGNPGITIRSSVVIWLYYADGINLLWYFIFTMLPVSDLLWLLYWVYLYVYKYISIHNILMCISIHIILMAKKFPSTPS